MQRIVETYTLQRHPWREYYTCRVLELSKCTMDPFWPFKWVPFKGALAKVARVLSGPGCVFDALGMGC